MSLSIFEAALGADAERLDPEVRRYLSDSGKGRGIGEGILEVAGSRLGMLNLLARPFAGPQLLITSHQRDVPFRIAYRAETSTDGAHALYSERSFRFRDGTQTLVDELSTGESPGRLRNALGRARRIELVLRCSADEEGRLILESEETRIRLGRVRFRLPRLLAVRAEVVSGYDSESRMHTIDASVRSPLLGSVLEYRGSFAYSIAGWPRS